MSRKITNPYIYKITHIETGRYYIGYKMARRGDGSMQMIGEDYYTSTLHPLIIERFNKECLHEWRIEIISEMSDECPVDMGVAANVIENILIKKSFNDPLIINDHYQDHEQGHQLFKSNRAGVKISDKTKELIRRNTIKQFSTKEARKRASENSLRRWRDPDYIAKQNTARVGAVAKRTGQKRSDDTRRRMSAAQMGKRIEKDYYCKECDRWICTQSIDKHNNGKQHRKNVYRNNNPDLYIYHCKPCNKTIKGVSNLNQHMNGASHHRAIEICTDTNTEIVYCIVCRDRLLSQNGLGTHYKFKHPELFKGRKS